MQSFFDYCLLVRFSLRRAMKIQKRAGSGRGSACSPPPPPSSLEDGAEEGEYVPNAQLDPALLRKIQTNKNLTKLDQEVKLAHYFPDKNLTKMDHDVKLANYFSKTNLTQLDQAVPVPVPSSHTIFQV
jgi:hypothetical protein